MLAADALGSTAPGAAAPGGASSGVKRPVIIFVPGGGWRQHGRFAPFGLNVGLARAFAKRGFVVAVTSYRLRGARLLGMLPLYLAMAVIASAIVTPALWAVYGSSVRTWVGGCVGPLGFLLFWHWFGWVANHSRVHHPGQLEDTAAAIAHIRANIHRYGGDASNVFVLGQSAGAHIVAMLALHPELFDVHGVAGGLARTNGFRGLVLLSPVAAPAAFLDTNVLSDRAEAARRAWPPALLQDSLIHFLYPAFAHRLGTAAEFNKCFPLRAAYDLGNDGIRALQLPPVFIMTTQGEFFIDTGVNALALALRNSDVVVHRYHILNADHGSYMFDADIPSKDGDRVVMPLIAHFLIACLTDSAPAPPAVGDAPV